MNQTTISTDIVQSLQTISQAAQYDKVLYLTDTNVQRFCFTPEFCSRLSIDPEQIICIPAGDEHKTIQTATQVWQQLIEKEATRHSLLINVGGGMVTDLGGFVASTFKRGMDCVNISTTLLGAVDAATGGKTGVNFMGFKNEIGAFYPAKQVILAAELFRTLDQANLRSGFAEMVKHALISTPQDLSDILRYDIERPDFEQLNTLLHRNVCIKQDIVEKDPKEKNIRKALNLGHTIGHAIESYSHTTPKPVLHGYAIMWGTVAELYLSHIKLGFPKQALQQVVTLMKEIYGKPNIGCKQYDTLLALMKHDKKNLRANEINFTLLADVGQIHINQTVTNEEIFEALDYVINC